MWRQESTTAHHIISTGIADGCAGYRSQHGIAGQVTVVVAVVEQRWVDMTTSTLTVILDIDRGLLNCRHGISRVVVVDGGGGWRLLVHQAVPTGRMWRGGVSGTRSLLGSRVHGMSVRESPHHTMTVGTGTSSVVDR